MRRLAREHGLLVGPSSGANMIAARRIRDELPPDSIVVTIACDEGEKYLSEYFIPMVLDTGSPVTATPGGRLRHESPC
jgi:cysteine synthase A